MVTVSIDAAGYGAIVQALPSPPSHMTADSDPPVRITVGTGSAGLTIEAAKIVREHLDGAIQQAEELAALRWLYDDATNQ